MRVLRFVRVFMVLAGILALSAPLRAEDEVEAKKPGKAILSVEPLFEGLGQPKRGAGRKIYVDGVYKGETDEGGRLSLKGVKPGPHVVTAVLPYYGAGQATVEVAPNKLTRTKIKMVEQGLSDALPVSLRLAQGGVQFDTEALDFSLASNTGAPIKIKKLNYVNLYQDATGYESDVTYLFKKNKGGVSVADGSMLGLIRDANRFQTLTFGVGLGNGMTAELEYSFVVARYSLQISVKPSGDDTTATVASVPVVLTNLDLDVTRTLTTDASGKINAGLLPVGNYGFTAEKTVGASTFSSVGTFALAADTTVGVNLLSVDEWANGDPAIEIVAGAAKAQKSAAARQPKRRPAFSRRGGSFSAPTAITPVEIEVSSGSEGVDMSNKGEATVPKGTKSITLEYEVASAEYPVYVLDKSEFDDQWSVVVLGPSGQNLFAINRSVNAQVSVQPVWQSSGSTGPIAQTINVEPYTSAGDAKITVIIKSKNIGDSALDTSVRAKLPAQLLVLKLDDEDGYPKTFTSPGGAIDGVAVTNKPGYFSIPRPGKTNTFEKGYRVTIQSPEGMKVSNLSTVSLSAMLDGVETKIFEGAPIPVAGEDRKFFVPATFGHSNPKVSAVASTPPPALQVKYLVKAQGTFESNMLNGQVESAAKMALWQMPDFPRYSKRDQVQMGFDHWATRGTYKWLEALTGKLPRINDISGEHGLSDRKNSHKLGVNIDMFHFGDTASFASSKAYYTQVQKWAVSVAQQPKNGEARQKLAQWAAAQRAGLEMLIAAVGTSQVRLVSGKPNVGVGDGIPAGWAKTLICTGVLPVAGGKPIQLLKLPKGSTCPSAAGVTVVFENAHDDHFHVQLPPAYNP